MRIVREIGAHAVDRAWAKAKRRGYYALELSRMVQGGYRREIYVVVPRGGDWNRKTRGIPKWTRWN